MSDISAAPSIGPLVAIVEDDEEIRTLAGDYLRREGFDVAACADGMALDGLMETRTPDLVILDLMMPGEDGLSICRRLSAHTDIPVIILSAKGEDIDRIIGLEVGADDYVPKPFNPRELCARVRAVLRRRAPVESDAVPTHGTGEVYRFENWRLDVEGRSLTDPEGALVVLSSGEFALLVAFARHPRRTLSRDQLLDWTRGADAAPVDRAIDVQLSRLRRKLRDNPRTPRLIKTVRGDGYMFAAEVQRERQP